MEETKAQDDSPSWTTTPPPPPPVALRVSPDCTSTDSPPAAAEDLKNVRDRLSTAQISPSRPKTPEKVPGDPANLQVDSFSRSLPGRYAVEASSHRARAELGDPHAQYELGLCYLYGRGVNEDEQNANSWFLKAAQQGHAPSLLAVGSGLATGSGFVTNKQLAFDAFSAAANSGDAAACGKLGLCYLNGEGVQQNDEKAIIWLSQAAAADDVRSILELGMCALIGRGRVKISGDDAIAWFRRAASIGDATGKFLLGICATEGIGRAKDSEDAAQWFITAGEEVEDAALALSNYPEALCSNLRSIGTMLSARRLRRSTGTNERRGTVTLRHIWSWPRVSGWAVAFLKMRNVQWS